MDYRKIIWLVLGLVCAPAAVLHAQTVTRGPYLQMGSTTAITVRWRTDQATDSVVRYGTSSSNLAQAKTDATVTKEHEVRLTGLHPNTKYYYSIGSSAKTLDDGDDCFFVTSPTGAKPTRVWLLGDPGTGTKEQNEVRDAYYKYTGNRHTDLWLMNGDNAMNNGTDAEYSWKLFRVYKDILKKSVLWPAYGNHDAGAANALTETGPYFDQHTLPRNGEAGGVPSGTEAYYSFDYGNIHFIMLEVFESSRKVDSPQAEWLKKDLAANKKDWTIVIVHYQVYSWGTEHNSDNTPNCVQLRENLVPILENGGVDLVISGHSHSYQRSYFLNGHYGMSNTFNKSSMVVQSGNGRVDGNGAYIKDMEEKAFSGTVYMVAGASGWVGGTAKPHPAMYTSMAVMGSVVMDFDGDQLDVRYIDRAGAKRDYLTIKKKWGSSKPGTPSDPVPPVTNPPVNTAPTVQVTSPAASSSYTAPASITINATASDKDGSVTKVEFLGGGKVLGSDTSAPYSFVWNNVPAGAQTITARATDNSGAVTTSSPVLVNVTAAPAAPQVVSSFTLINADTNQPVSGYETISNGAVLVRSALPKNLSLRANTTPAIVGSVRFAWAGNSNYRTETEAPYALFGGKGSDDFVPGTIANGAHTIKATPYTEASGKGTAGTSLTISFSIVDQPVPPVAPEPEPEPAPQGDAVVGFSLIDANTNQPVPGYENIANGAVISRASLPTTRLCVRVNTNPSVVGSVRIGWNANANYRLENEAPYALFGGNGSDPFAGGSIANGTHTVTATPYSKTKGQGTAGKSLSVTFKIQ